MLVLTNESEIGKYIPFALVLWVLKEYQGWEDVLRQEFEIPAHIRDLDCPLYGEVMGDEPVPEQQVVWEKFPDSPAKFRIVHKPLRKTRVATIEAGPDSHGHACAVQRLYSGPKRVVPKDDPSISSEYERVGVESFWLKHALSSEMF